MGGLLKIISRSPRRRKRKHVKAASGTRQKKKQCSDGNRMQFEVTSTPKEYSSDMFRSFNWLTKQMDDFQVSDCGSGSTDDTASSCVDDDEATDPTVTNAHGNRVYPCDKFSAWEWIMSCFGSVNKAADHDDERRTEYESSYEVDDDDVGSGESSQPSMSRINSVLKLPAMADDVSDITSVASVDDSIDSDEDENDDV